MVWRCRQNVLHVFLLHQMIRLHIKGRKLHMGKQRPLRWRGLLLGITIREWELELVLLESIWKVFGILNCAHMHSFQVHNSKRFYSAIARAITYLELVVLILAGVKTSY